MKSWTIATILLPAAALAFPQMNARRYVNETVTATPAPTTTSPPLNNTIPPYTPSGTATPTVIPTAVPTAACLPGKYQCTYSPSAGWGWSVCDTTANWAPAGSCAAGETCTYNPINGSPYCVATPSTPGGGPTPQDPTQECSPDRYQCAHSDAKGWYINQCGADHKWKEVVSCHADETCTYGAVHGYPYCKPKADARVCTPGAFECHYDNDVAKWGWRACSAEGAWVQAGYCNAGQTCSFNPLNGSPYCS